MESRLDKLLSKAEKRMGERQKQAQREAVTRARIERERQAQKDREILAERQKERHKELQAQLVSLRIRSHVASGRIR
jgi:hypothetical protein